MGVNISIAEVNGPYGAKRLEISCEFSPPGGDDTEGVVCDEGYDMLVGVLYSSNALTFENLDMLYGASDTGWMCMNTEVGHYYGEVYGQYIGGTGRFEQRLHLGLVAALVPGDLSRQLPDLRVVHRPVRSRGHQRLVGDPLVTPDS